VILFLFYLWHYSSCVWFFINIKCEDDDYGTWVTYHDLKYEDLED
jgi:hypothetical protein